MRGWRGAVAAARSRGREAAVDGRPAVRAKRRRLALLPRTKAAGAWQWRLVLWQRTGAMRAWQWLLALSLGAWATSTWAAAGTAEYAAVPRSPLRSVLPGATPASTLVVQPLKMRRLPVTNAEFLQFVREHPRWQRGAVPRTLADEHYLESWSAATDLGPRADPRQPVTQVSWFAARAFCAANKARLPTWNEWELVAAADAHRADARADPVWQSLILGWYSQPSIRPLQPVGQGQANFYGIHDLHGLIWEWVEDFNALLIDADNRVQGDPEKLKFCGSGALSVQDRENYPTMMRLALLSSLRGNSTTANLGFRCVSDPHPDLDEGVRLQSQSGRWMSFDSGAAGPRLVTMFYASCSMACPLTIDTLQAIERQLSPADRARLRVLMVSFDSQRDTPSRLRALAQERRLDLSRWTLARAEPGEVRELSARLDIPYRRLENGSFNHLSRLVLMNGTGEVLASSLRMGAPDPAFVAAVRQALNSPSR